MDRRERHRTSLTLFPRTAISGLEEESIKKLFDKPTRRQCSFVADVTSVMRERQQRTYLPRTFTQTGVFEDDDE